MDYLKLDGIQAMLEKAANDIVREAVFEAPELTGDLRDSITAGDFNPADNSIDVFIDPNQLSNQNRWNGMYYPELVHEGTKPHEIRPKNGKVLSWQTSQGFRVVQSGKRAGQINRSRKNDTYAYTKVVHHPGTAPNPFFTRALEKVLAISDFKDKIQLRLIKTEIE
jgi:hypothetical protein